jgi:hypothetical protein
MDTKHLEFIQNIIARLAGNSFQMKSWNVALATAAVGLAAAKDSKPTLAVLAIIPAFAFWLLDSYYLAQEKRYRVLYSKATEPPQSFSLDAGQVTAGDLFKCMFRLSVFGLHLPMLGVILLVTLTGALR